MNRLLEVAGAVITALERAGVAYSVGGSFASAFSGEPRASVDVDIVVDLKVSDVGRFIDTLGPDFYADATALTRAVTTRSSANVIHQRYGIKVDLFVAGSPLERRQLQRRRAITVSEQPHREWFVHTPEDILLQKLWWFRQGGEVSERQWRDVIGILVVQGDRLDTDYLSLVAAEVGVDDLLGRATDEAEG